MRRASLPVQATIRMRRRAALFSNLAKDDALRRAFDSFDKNSNGLLDPPEFLMLCWRIGFPLQESELDAVYSSLDTSHDGVVSFEEFKAWLDDRWGKGQRKERKLKRFFLSLPSKLS